MRPSTLRWCSAKKRANPLNLVTDQSKGLAWPAGQDRNRIQDAHGLDLRAQWTKCAAVAMMLPIVLFSSYAAGYQVGLYPGVVLASLGVCAASLAVPRQQLALSVAGH